MYRRWKQSELEVACAGGRILEYLPQIAPPVWPSLLIQSAGSIAILGMQAMHEQAERRAWAAEKAARRVRELAKKKRE